MKIRAAYLEELLYSYDLKEILEYLPTELRIKIGKFVKSKDAWRSLVAQLLIRTSIMETFRVRPNEFLLTTNKYGKPFWEQNPDYYFNVSHSGDWIVCVTAPCPVGIDIEKIEDIDISISEKIFSKLEVATLNSLPAEERNLFFFDLWTLKESYIKAIGKGLYHPLDTFSIIKSEGRISLVDSGNEWYFQQYSIDSQYKMSVCSRKNDFSKKIDITPGVKVVENYLHRCKLEEITQKSQTQILRT